MLSPQEKIKNLVEIINQQKLSPETRQILEKEISRLKQELARQ